MKKRVISAIVILVMLVSQIGVFAHWADPYFAELYKKEIMFGDNEGFRGDDPLLRCEFAAMLNRAFSFTRIKTPVMPDVYKSDWYYNDLYTLASAGIITGDSDGMLHPKYPITRAEAAVMIQRATKLSDVAVVENTDDEDIPKWAQGAVSALMERKVINGYPDGKFHGNSFLLRGEAAVILVNAIKLSNFSEGEGTKENPYIIRDERQVKSINNDLNACYRLEADLEFDEIEFPLIGNENTSFDGVFDGNGHRVVVTSVSGGNNVLFKKVGLLGEIKNLYLVCPENRIAISATNNGTIYSCANTSWKGTGKDYSRYFGSIAQVNNGGISFCYNLSDVVCLEAGYVSGGIAGVNNKLIENCFSNAKTDKAAGGIVGENNGKISNSYTLSNRIARYQNGETESTYAGSEPLKNFKSENFVNVDGSLVPVGVRYLKNENFVLYGGGDGSKNNPYIIKNGTHFANISKNPDKHFVQLENIDVTETAEAFSGTYDGNGFYINTLRLRGGEDVALFAENRGTIKNVLVKDGLVSGNMNVSGIVLSNYGTVSRCAFNGLVTGGNGGGICKTNYETGVIDQCFFTGRVATDRTAAAICCENSGVITNVYSNAEVLGYMAGGIVNYNRGKLKYCYYSGNKGEDFGGIAYENYGEIQSAYATSPAAVMFDEGICAFVMVRTEEELAYPELLQGFDFNFIWKSGGNSPVFIHVPEFSHSEKQNMVEFSGGSGSVTDPFKIATPAQLAAIASYPDKNFILLGDIDLNDVTSKNKAFKICESFTGTLDGNGKSIYGMHTDNTNGALFSENRGVIRNLGVENSSFYGENSAAIAIANYGIIQNCRSDVTLKNGGSGIVHNNYGNISRSWSSCDIYGNIGAGIAYTNEGEILQSYSVADIYAKEGYGISTGGHVRESWFGGVLYGKTVIPLPDEADTNCFYLDYYGLENPGGVMLESDIDECYTKYPWVWKDGMPVLNGMRAPEITNFKNLGDGTKASPFIITKWQQLKFLGMYNDSYFKLDKNLNAEGQALLHLRNFKGELDGNGKKISNFSVTSEKGGFIGTLSGKVKNLILSDFSVEGETETGGIAAVNNGTIENVRLENGRIGTSGIAAGGVAGINGGSGLITGCINLSDVFSAKASGGIVGDNRGTVVLSANHGGIVATADAKNAMSGGIAGQMIGVVDRCYNNGKILSYSESDESISGGIAGVANGSILNCYNTGEITAKARTSALSGGICGNSDNIIEISKAYNTGFTNATADKVYQGSAVARAKRGKLNSFVYEHTLMPPVDEGELSESLVFAYPEDMFIREIGFNGFDFENVWSFAYDKYYYFPQLKGNEQDSIVMPENRTEFAGGDGSLENPYKIITPEQLNNVRKHLGSTFMLIGDIDMTNYCSENEFLPIGDSVFSFFGLFIGNNYTISGLKFKGDDFGLFRENHGEIYNCFFDHARGSGSGGTIAKSNTGLIYNCVNLSDENEVSENNNLNRGGLVGINKSTGMIISSYNAGNLVFEGENVQAGGIVHANYGIVSGSFNSGSIRTKANQLSVAGGVAASNFGVVSDCYCADTAYSESNVAVDSYSGGILGNNAGTLVNCYFSGFMDKSDGRYGSIAATNTGSLVNCYYSGDQGVDRNTGVSENVVSCTEQELMQPETFVGFDFDNMWIMDESFRYKYPQFIEIAHRD